jgi:hypothetical protein
VDPTAGRVLAASLVCGRGAVSVPDTVPFHHVPGGVGEGHDVAAPVDDVEILAGGAADAATANRARVLADDPVRRTVTPVEVGVGAGDGRAWAMA